MASLKWLYSYRILTARLREGADAPTSLTAGFTTGSAPLQQRQSAVNDELTQGKPAKPALLLTAGRKKI